MKKLLTKLSPIGMLMDDPDKLKYVSPIAMLLSSGNKDKDNKNQTNQVTRQTEQAKQQSFKKGGQIKKEPLKNNLDKGMEADRTGLLKERKVKNNDMDSPDYTPATPMEIYQDMRPVTDKTPPQVQGFGKARKPIR